MAGSTLIVGAVAYDPKVVAIWEGFKAWFAERGFAMDYVLYSHYERQVSAQFAGAFDVAWNSPLAWLQTERIAAARGRRARAFTMRDTDRDLTSVVVVRADGPTSLADLRGRRVGVGAPDSPQATLIPLQHLADAGLPEAAVDVRVFDVLFGKHGDHVGGERLAARALLAGEVDAACMIDGNHLAFGVDGTLPAGSTRILAQTAPYDHCVFTALDGVDEAAVSRFATLLLGQRFDDPTVRPLLELEGLKRWHEGRNTGFGQLARAVDRLAIAAPIREFVAGQGR